jgi:hypothetical protein
MDMDWALIGVVVAAFLYLSGYRLIGVVLGLLMFLVLSVATVAGASSKKAESASADMLEPIVIESTRTIPYRIPENLDIRYDREADFAPKWFKIGKKWGKAFGQVAGKTREEL